MEDPLSGDNVGGSARDVRLDQACECRLVALCRPEALLEKSRQDLEVDGGKGEGAVLEELRDDLDKVGLKLSHVLS